LAELGLIGPKRADDEAVFFLLLLPLRPPPVPTTPPPTLPALVVLEERTFQQSPPERQRAQSKRRKERKGQPQHRRPRPAFVKRVSARWPAYIVSGRSGSRINRVKDFCRLGLGRAAAAAKVTICNSKKRREKKRLRKSDFLHGEKKVYAH
jgi:hypothetical protein